MSEVRYRQMEVGDLGETFEVRVRTWHNERGAAEMLALGITPEAVTALMETTHRGWVAECDGAIVGFTMGDGSTGEMWVVAVLKAYEGRGIGRGLMERVEGWLTAQGNAVLWLTTDVDENVRAVGFYRRLGWEDWKFEDGDRFMRKVGTRMDTNESRMDTNPGTG